ncbi:MAG: hypothetical protein AAGA94_05010 [Pseudomonadota bacterium]
MRAIEFSQIWIVFAVKRQRQLPSIALHLRQVILGWYNVKNFWKNAPQNIEIIYLPRSSSARGVAVWPERITR